MFDVPILYIVFNRLDTIKQTFPKIQEIKPKQLFIAADGPRASRSGEDVKCKQVREYVLSQINWDCDVHTLFREENLGCGRNVSKAITWFFDNVEKGIIMEDDILVTKSFFYFMQVLLEKYKDDNRIMHIAGYNPLTVSKSRDDSYFFIRKMLCWGWGSWSRAWKNFSFDLTDTHDFCNSRRFKKAVPQISARNELECLFDIMEQHVCDTWDAQWEFAVLKNNGICIAPCKNLITNVGIGPDATHPMGDGILKQERFDIDELLDDQKLNHPSKVKIHKTYESKIRYLTLNLKKQTFKMVSDYYFEKLIKLPLRKILKRKSLRNAFRP